MKVAIYSGTSPSTTFIEDLINVIASNGVEVHLFGTKTGSKSYQYSNIHQFLTPSQSLNRLVFTIFQLFFSFVRHPTRLFKLLGKLDKSIGWKGKINWLSKTLPVINNLPDIFHVQWAKSASDWIFLKDLFGVRMVLSLRGAHINYSPICDPELAETYRQTFPRYDAFHAVSKAIVKEAEKYGAESSKIKVIYSGVDLNKIQKVKKEIESNHQINIYPPRLQRRWKSANRHQLKKSTPDNYRDKRLNIISVGRFHWKKGYKYAIDACHILKDKQISFHYTIVARGDPGEYLFQINDLNLQDYVSIVPGPPQEELMVRVAKSDLFLLPSIEEGIANVVLEAMALGCPVVSTDCGGMTEVIKNDHNAFIIPMRSPKEIADALIKYRSLSEKKIKEIRKNAFATVNDRFALDTLGKEMECLYISVMEAW